jgi:AcrR family transcriptional regulator
MRDSVKQRTVKDAILDATDQLLTRFGYKKMTIDDLAREVGIGKGTVYLHFRSKEDIAVSWIDRANERVRAKLEEIAQSDASIPERLRKILVARVMIRFDYARNYNKSLDELLVSIRPMILLCRHNWHEAEAKILERVLADGKAKCAFAFDDALTVARTLLLATNSLLPYNLSARQLGERDEIEITAARIAGLLLDGLLAR